MAEELRKAVDQLNQTKRFLWLALSQLPEKRITVRDDQNQIPLFWRTKFELHPDKMGATLSSEEDTPPTEEQLTNLAARLLASPTCDFLSALKTCGLDHLNPRAVADLLKPRVHWDGNRWMDTALYFQRMKQNDS